MVEYIDMEKIIAASGNKDKIKEIEAITRRFGMVVVSMKEAGILVDDIEENGTTFEENSYIKAKTIWDISHKTTIADDSGLEVDYLDGAPGIYSARFAGEDCNYTRNNEKLLGLLEGVPCDERTARFVTVITMILEDGEVIVARGECPGHIAEDFLGEGGFGYDPVFVPEGYSESFAQMGTDAKNRIGHRARALEKLTELLTERGL